MPLQYLLDEHVPPRLRRELLRRAPEVQVVAIGDPGVPALGTLDPQVLIWCEENEFVLITNNRGSMPAHLADHLSTGRHVPGIFVYNPRRSIRSIVEELILLAEASLPDEHRDLIQFLPII